MATLIDSSLLIAAERGAFDLPGYFGTHSSEAFAIAAVTASELLHGTFRGREADRIRRQSFVEDLLTRLPVLPIDLPVARVHAELWAGLASQGITVPTHDLLIAATALVHDAAVATRDRRSFPKIPRLRVVLL